MSNNTQPIDWSKDGTPGFDEEVTFAAYAGRVHVQHGPAEILVWGYLPQTMGDTAEILLGRGDRPGAFAMARHGDPHVQAYELAHRPITPSEVAEPSGGDMEHTEAVGMWTCPGCGWQDGFGHAALCPYMQAAVGRSVSAPAPEAAPELPMLNDLLTTIATPSPEDECVQGDMNLGAELFWALGEDHRNILVKLCRRYVTSQRKLLQALAENKAKDQEIERLQKTIEELDAALENFTGPTIDAMTDAIQSAALTSELPHVISMYGCIVSADDFDRSDSVESMLVSLRLENADYCRENRELKHAAPLPEPEEGHNQHYRNPDSGQIECERCCGWALDYAEQKKLLTASESAMQELRRELRVAQRLEALLANGMPPTGNSAFDEVLDIFPIAAMIERGWLLGITGFDDLPLLEKSICRFFEVDSIEKVKTARFSARGKMGGQK